MIYQKLKDILLSNEVYNLLKQNETKLFKLFPELKNCKGFNQNSEWHIYDVYEHILHVVAGVDNNIYLRIAALFHDIGKPLTYIEDENRVGHFYNHWNISVKIFKKYQNNFDLSDDEINLIINLIFYHDINIDKISMEDKVKMLKNFDNKNLWMLFNLKKADLLAQSSKFHHLLDVIEIQEQNII